MNLFVAILSFFCLYLLHCAEAKAATFSSHDYYSQHKSADSRIEVASAILVKQSPRSAEVNKWPLWSYEASGSLNPRPPVLQGLGVATSFKIIGAKDFVIRTGLSPPVLFA